MKNDALERYNYLQKTTFDSMKILHTADWHLGKVLKKYSLRQELELFIDWLLALVANEQIDIVLIAGDIFDYANPSNVDRQLYYQVLSRFKELNVQCIVTAGNHDSPSLLEAPQEVLKSINTHVVGFGHDKERQLITLSVGAESAHFLAVPFLRSGDVRESVAGESYDDRIQGLRLGIESHYKDLVQLAKKKDSGLPIVALGHLYLQGSSLSDSERDIHIGNQAGLEAKSFESLFNYFALGHIHRPQKLNKEGTIRYCGSPISLSFSERKDTKQVCIINIKEGKVDQANTVDIPTFRPLVLMKGNLEEVKEELNQYRSPGSLPALVENQVEEEERDSSKIIETIKLSEQNSEHYIIVNHKIHFTNEIKKLSQIKEGKQIEELQPLEVFKNRIEGEALEEKDTNDLQAAFEEAYELAQKQL